jgi:hypothetical protein
VCRKTIGSRRLEEVADHARDWAVRHAAARDGG